LHRPQPGKPLALGIGRHHCIGAALARQEIISAFKALLGRLDKFRLAADSATPEYQPSFFGRKLRTLHLEFEASTAM
jgi:cytochrome P450